MGGVRVSGGSISYVTINSSIAFVLSAAFNPFAAFAAEWEFGRFEKVKSGERDESGGGGGRDGIVKTSILSPRPSGNGRTRDTRDFLSDARQNEPGSMGENVRL